VAASEKKQVSDNRVRQAPLAPLAERGRGEGASDVACATAIAKRVYLLTKIKSDGRCHPNFSELWLNLMPATSIEEQRKQTSRFLDFSE